MDNRIPWLPIILGGLLSTLVAAYSAYAGLKIGGVYWPILATSVVSLALLKALGKKGYNQANILQTGANSGGLLAAGIIFTVPAAWMLGFPFTLAQITLTALAGSLLGLVFSIPLRRRFLHLPYPDGTAAAVLLKAGDEGGKKIKQLTATSFLGGLIALLRDYLKAIPGVINLKTLGISRTISLGFNVSAIGFAGGFLIGTLFTSIWFAGAAFSYLLIPLISARTVLEGSNLRLTLTNLGIGIIIGTSVVYLLLTLLPIFKNLLSDWQNLSKKGKNYAPLALILATLIIVILTKANLFVTAASVLGAFLMAYIGAQITGQLNIDPMEIFAIIVLLAVKMFFPTSLASLIVLAAIITISAGVAGDIMQDYKTGSLLHTNPTHQTLAQIVGSLSASLVIGLIILSIAQTGGFGTPEFPAPQATAIAGLIGSKTLQKDLLIGIGLGVILSFLASKKGLGLAPVAFGIGMYVPMELSFSLFIGGLVRHFVEKRKLLEKGRLSAAGFIAGESLVGVILSLISFFHSLSF